MRFEEFPRLKALHDGTKDPRLKAALIHLARNSPEWALNALERGLALQPTPPADRTPITELSINVKTRYALSQNGITTVEHLAEKTKKQLENMRGMGDVGIGQIETALANRKRALADTRASGLDPDVVELLRSRR